MVGVHLLVELAGDHPDLPFAELDVLGTIVERGLQVAVVDCQNPGEVSRLALAHTVMEYLGSCPAKKDAFISLLEHLALSSPRPFAGRVKKVQGNTMDTTQAELERIIGAHVKGKVNLRAPEEEFRVIVSGSTCYLGRVVWRSDPWRFAERRPGDRPFFHPGVMMPRMVRALLNISCIREGQRLLDPFSGTGGMVMEAGLLGVIATGSDVDPVMVRGSRLNAPAADLLLADGGRLPFREASFDAIVTDLPYGQSVSIRARNLDCLYHDALSEITRVLGPGRRAVLVTHRDIRELAGSFMTVKGCYSQRVHRSLTRHILVLVRDGQSR